MEKLLEKYLEKFGEQFPLMLCMGMSEEAIMKLIQECIDAGKPYELDDDDKNIY